ncbi:MAG: DNA-directed DNA polymerase II small subunit [Methanocellales archaeon]
MDLKLNIVREFANHGFCIEPEAVNLFNAYQGRVDDLISKVLNSLDSNVLVISREHVKKAIAAERKAISLPKNVEHDFKILSDITNRSTCIGDLNEFITYFKDRYQKLSDMIRKRLHARPIESLKGKKGSEGEVAIIGMVSDIRTTSNGHRLIELEDRTGVFPVLISKDRELFSQPILLDEVIGVSGFLTNNNGLLIANNIFYPDIPVDHEPNIAREDICAALISDIHVGSRFFLEDAWMSFIKWLNLEVQEESELAMRIRYLIIAGDLVDGIGVYPNQDRELSIKDIYEQYEKAAEYLAEVPSHIQIIISPGNHDAVRQAEPQPAIGNEYIKPFKMKNVKFIGNPALIELHGIKILIYHGRSLDDLKAALPNASYDKPEKLMVEMLKRRHLAPIYGGKVLIAPEKNDHFVINTIPEILHCGHVHTVGCMKYRGVTLVNSGTWQSQTEYQRALNLTPMPARASIVDLKTLETKILRFGY